MKYFLIAGEASGDKHASLLIHQIRQRDPQASFSGLGGSQMATAECRLYQDYSHMAFMGFAAVLRNWREVKRNFQIAQEALLAERPDALILIDYPSFNLQMAAFCRKHLPKTKIYYYIPPKVWAWKKKRLHKIARLCDKVLGILPFEPAFYAKYGYECTYVGNPTVEEINKSPITNRQLPISKSIAILPGSRKSEITNCLPRMLKAARRFPEYTITVCAAPDIPEDLYRPYLAQGEALTHDTYSALQQASAAIVNSGTATLEAALLRCPQVAVYHLACAWLIGINRWWLQPALFTIPYFTLANIIAGKQVIREFVTHDFTADNVAAELNCLLTDDEYTKKMLDSYEHLSSLLGTQPASSTAASIITQKP